VQLLLSLLLFSWISAFGNEIAIPNLASPVMDEAKFLTIAENNNLSELIYEIRSANGPQITVLMVNDLQGYPIEEFSIRVAEKWQLGTKKEGNGLLIVIAKQEHKIRIEVGEGIEGEITDFEANKYITKVLIPSFRAGEFYSGLRLVIEDVAKKFNIEIKQRTKFVRRASHRQPGRFDSLLPIAIIILVFGHLFFRKRPLARGLASGIGMASASYFMVPGIGLGFIMLFFLGLIVGLVGLNNILYGLASSSGGRYGGGLGGGGRGGWSGGGGGFSGGGSSGSW
jgi:uncharacterized protein